MPVGNNFSISINVILFSFWRSSSHVGDKLNPLKWLFFKDKTFVKSDRDLRLTVFFPMNFLFTCLDLRLNE